MGGRSRVSEWLCLPFGAPRVKVDEYKPKGKKGYQRWIAECGVHAGCQKKKSTKSDRVHGRVGPLWYLAAWSELGSDVTHTEHQARAFPVSQDAVDKRAAIIGSNVNHVLEALDK